MSWHAIKLLTAALILFSQVSCNLTSQSNKVSDEVRLNEAREKAAIQSFEKIRSDWETLIDAYANETNQLGKFNHIGFLPDTANPYWRVYEMQDEIGLQYIESIISFSDCGAGQIWINSYSIQEKEPSLKTPGLLGCLQVFLKYGTKKSK